MPEILADVYKKGILAGHFSRTDDGATAYTYASTYLETSSKPLSPTLPLSTDSYRREGGALPPFFTGLLPEGRRLTGLRKHLKTSADDELGMLIAVGEDTVGDVQIVSPNTQPAQLVIPDAGELIQSEDFQTITFSELINRHSIIDPAAIPGVQDKVSGKMLTLPLRSSEDFYLLKISPPEYPQVVENESFFLKAASRIHASPQVVSHRLVHDATGRSGILIRRFDRYIDEHGIAHRLAAEDACQLSNRYPSDKYLLTAEQCSEALLTQVFSPRIAAPEVFRQFVYAWLTGNGDLHAKNLSIVENRKGQYELSPIYDIPSTAPHGDKSMALLLSGKKDGLSRRRFLTFAHNIGVSSRVAEHVLEEVLTGTEHLAEQAREELPFDSHRMKELLKVLKNRRRSLL